MVHHYLTMTKNLRFLPRACGNSALQGKRHDAGHEGLKLLVSDLPQKMAALAAGCLAGRGRCMTTEDVMTEYSGLVGKVRTGTGARAVHSADPDPRALR